MLSEQEKQEIIDAKIKNIEIMEFLKQVETIVTSKATVAEQTAALKLIPVK